MSRHGGAILPDVDLRLVRRTRHPTGAEELGAGSRGEGFGAGMSAG